MESTIGEAPEYPRFDRAEFQFACMCLFTHLGIIFKYPLELGCGEIAVEQKSGFLTEQVRVHARSKRPANRFASRILPDNRRSKRLASILIPNDKCLALVIKSHCCNVISFDERRNGLFNGTKNVVRILLDPARVWKARR